MLPIYQLEGTWEEISAQIPKDPEQKFRVLVYPRAEDASKGKDSRPIEEIAAELAAKVPPEEFAKLPPDLSDQLDHYIYGTPKR